MLTVQGSNLVGQDIPHSFRPVVGLTHSSVQWVLCRFPGGKLAGELITPSSAEIKERVELYLYSLSGPSLPDLC